jgi:DNA polymerase III epsilon subunit-like protein
MIPNPSLEAFISVDVETAGPHPSRYALLSIGACLVADPRHGFYAELKPDRLQATEDALHVSQFSLESLLETGVPAAEAMTQFETWIAAEVPSGQKPIFVAFNAPFDWMFVNDYFHRYLGKNPFGYSALDIKAFFMGMTGVQWAESTFHHIATRYIEGRSLTHNALQDARDQAFMFQAMLEDNLRAPLEGAHSP